MRRIAWIAPLLLLAVPALADRGAPMGPGLYEAPLVCAQHDDAGLVRVWNTNRDLHVEVEMYAGWELVAYELYVGNDPVPVNRGGNPVPGRFTYRYEYDPNSGDGPVTFVEWDIHLEQELDFKWGRPWEDERVKNLAFHASVQQRAADGTMAYAGGAWWLGKEYEGAMWGWWVDYELTHPKQAHFIDSPVHGVTVVSPTYRGRPTDTSGSWPYFPGEEAEFRVGPVVLGSAEADHKVSPLDLFPDADLEDERVGNMAMFLQSLDADAEPKQGITITDEVVACLGQALADTGVTALDWAADAQVDAVVDVTIGHCPFLVKVTREDAIVNLARSLGSSMFRKNVSGNPGRKTAKSKIDLMPTLVPATRANGDSAAPVEFFDEDGNALYTRDLVKPLVSVYAEQLEETGMSDVFAAVSRDDGDTWKRMNLSRAADRTSFTLANGQPYYGDVKKPNLSIKGNYALAVWQSKFCRGGRPRYSRDEFLDDGVTPDPQYVDDMWGVGGPQRSHDYTEEGFPEVGELPYYCLWACRGTVDPDTAEITWRKPERLTSGRRDVWQIMINGAKDVGFGIVWQEDPEGVRPGEMAGPGHGWSGATTNHKTDIWYSFITWDDFALIDEDFSPNGDPAHSFDDPEWTTNRPMPLVPFQLPRRFSDNDVCNTDNMKVVLDEATGLPPTDELGRYVFTPLLDPEDPEWDGKHTGTHRYCYLLDDNANGIPDLCADFHTFVNSQDAVKHVCVTEDGRLLDGDTGASRANVMFMPYKKKDGSQSAWVAVVYEETKGVGSGRPEWDDDPETTHDEEKAKPDEGKNVIYHSFEFSSPGRVESGDVVNLPERNELGDLVYLVDEYGELVLDWQGQPQLAYENARRPRLLVQPPGQAGSTGTVMVLLYKQGEEGKGRPSDIFMRRVVKGSSGNPFAFANFVCNETELAANGRTVCRDGHQNLSSVTPIEYWENPDQDDQAKGEGIKVVKYEQLEANLDDESWTNPYDDARAHRGILRGDNLFVAFDYTPNWAAARNAHDKYDVFVRRSFNGGGRWSTDSMPVRPDGVDAEFDNTEVCHTRLWKDYDSVVSEDEVNKKETYEEVVCFAPGAYEPARNMSLLKNNKTTVIEPRLVGPPSSTPGSPYPEDVRNTDVFYLAFGTATNVPKPHGSDDDDEDDEESVPDDLFYTFTRDRGQSFYKKLWEVNPDSDGNWAGQVVERYDYLAKGDPEQGEAQIRMSPDGSRFYAVWNQEDGASSDMWFRRIMSREFPGNRGQGPDDE